MSKKVIKNGNKFVNNKKKAYKKWQKKNALADAIIKVTFAGGSFIAVSKKAKHDARKAVAEAMGNEQNPAPAPEKKKAITKIPVIGKFFDKKDATPVAAPTAAPEAAPTV